MKIISWNTTNACNMYCAHCYRDAGCRAEEELNTEEGKKLLSEIAKAGFKIMIFSGGEPLMRPDILELVKYASDLHMIPVFGTNGTLITLDMAKKLKEAGADILIFAPHWGTEGSYKVTANQESFAHAAIDAGAHIVFGTHPHVLQKMEAYNGGYIFYSLGNFSFGGNTAPRDVDTAIAQVTVKKDGDSWAVDDYDLIPCRLSSTDSKNDYCPRPYKEDEEGYTRALSKLDGSWTGSDLSVDYSFMYR